MACKNLAPFALPPATTLVVDLYHMLDLRSDARRRLLAYYFTNPAARHHLRDLAERLSTDPSNLSKELRRLEREGFERKLVEELRMHLAWRWFTGLGFDQEIPHHSTFSKNRHGRFQESKLFEQLFEEIVKQCVH
jgi:DNA-binding Lrp family transcriptional regulator